MMAKSEVYRVFGAENSPFSVKVRAYLRYKEIPHEWIVRNGESMQEFKKFAKLPLIPLLLTPDNQALQDSTPIIERLEAAHASPSIYPADPAMAFISALIEEFGDEWGNKWMLHYRWAREADQKAASGRLVREMMPEQSVDEQAGMARKIAERMCGRVWFVGSNPTTAEQIEDSFREALGLLESHLEKREFLLGSRPSLGDFGLWGQLYNASLDPTPGAILRDKAPSVMRWIERMLEPKASGDFENWESLAPTLAPFLEEMCGKLFLPWTVANAEALASEQESYDVELKGRIWTQKPIKYQAKSLIEIRKKYAEVADKGQLDLVLEQTGCRSWLQQPY